MTTDGAAERHNCCVCEPNDKQAVPSHETYLSYGPLSLTKRERAGQTQPCLTQLRRPDSTQVRTLISVIKSETYMTDRMNSGATLASVVN